MEPVIHELKTDTAVFNAVWLGQKHFEIRKDDRCFNVGDELYLRETVYSGREMAEGAPLEWTGKTMHKVVTYILRGPIYGLAEGWVIMSIINR